MLYLVPTPIGNLADITLRAQQVLQSVDLILSEDTRVSAKLLNHLNIEKKMWSYHAHNEHQTLSNIIAELQSGKNIALISDAGTPGISDPGYLLVKACHDQDIPVTCLPGPSACITALAASGLPSDRFFFEGFLPHKKGRKTRLSYLSELPHTFIIYESPFRLVRCLEELMESCGSRRMVCIARELTKIHEDIRTDTLENLHIHYKSQQKVKGEIVIVVSTLSK